MQLEYAEIGAVAITGAHLPVIGVVTATLRNGTYCRALRRYVVTDTATELVFGIACFSHVAASCFYIHTYIHAFDYYLETDRVGG